MHKHRKIKGNSRFGSLCGPGRLFCFSMAKKRCLCYTCLSDFACGAEKEKLKKRKKKEIKASPIAFWKEKKLRLTEPNKKRLMKSTEKR